MKEKKSLSNTGKRIWLEANDVLDKRVKIRQYNKSDSQKSRFNTERRSQRTE